MQQERYCTMRLGWVAIWRCASLVLGMCVPYWEHLPVLSVVYCRVRVSSLWNRRTEICRRFHPPTSVHKMNLYVITLDYHMYRMKLGAATPRRPPSAHRDHPDFIRFARNFSTLLDYVLCRCIQTRTTNRVLAEDSVCSSGCIYFVTYASVPNMHQHTQQPPPLKQPLRWPSVRMGRRKAACTLV